MDMTLGEALTRWSVRLAVACYLARVWLDLGKIDETRRWARRFQTAGFVLYLLHVVSAFEFHHDWSHRDAYRETAEQTEALTGIRWGGGLYFNYAFTVFWAVDVILWQLRGLDFPYRSRHYLATVHGVFAFMIINATVVFGPPLWKVAAILFAVCVAVALRRR